MAGHRVYVREKKTKAGKKGVAWPEKKRLEAVTTFLTTGSNAVTSAMTGVPIDTINLWKRQDWWKKYCEDLQYEDDLKLSSSLEKVMQKSLDAVMDRIENGDVVYDARSGKAVRIPAKLRDLQKVSTDMVDRKLLLRKAHELTQRKEKEQKEQVTGDHLVQLAQAFAQFAMGQKPKEELIKPAEVIEGDYKQTFEELGYEVTREEK